MWGWGGSHGGGECDVRRVWVPWRCGLEYDDYGCHGGGECDVGQGWRSHGGGGEYDVGQQVMWVPWRW